MCCFASASVAGVGGGPPPSRTTYHGDALSFRIHTETNWPIAYFVSPLSFFAVMTNGPRLNATFVSAPLDTNFLGVGQTRTNADGEYRFLTIKPGPYPWGNHPNAWRPAHIHFSLMGPSVATRLVTQMYFPDDPLFALDPIFQSVPEHARRRLIATYDHDVTIENWALGYRWDIVLRGTAPTS